MSMAASTLLMEQLKHLSSLLRSRPASTLPLNQQRALKRLIDSFPIEFAQLKASPKQTDFQRVFFDRSDGQRRLDTFVALGANRSGKTFVCGWLCFAKHLRDVAKNGGWYWCVGQNLDRSVVGQQRELWEALPRWMFADRTWDEKIGFGAHRKIILPTSDGGKCMVEFRSADQDLHTFEQAKLDGVWCDERLPEPVYNRLLLRLVDRRGFILYSDIPEQWWQYERLVNAKPAAGVYCQEFAMHDNAHNLPAGEIEIVAAKMTDDERKQRIMGQFVVMEGVVYREFDQHTHSIKPFRKGVPAKWPKWRIIDYGGSAPTACVWITIGPTEEAYIYREYYQANLTVARNAAAIIEMSGDEQYVKTYIDPHAIDKPPAYYSASSSIAKQYADAGIASTGWPYVNVMGEHALVQRVKFRLENHTLYVFDTCTNMVREFRSWKYKTDKEGRPLAADAFEDGNNHLLDCIKGFFGTNPCYTFGKAKVEVYG